jgi:hypothetical protein
VVVDGRAESQALRTLFQKIVVANRRLSVPLYADMQPKASPAQIVRAAQHRLSVLKARGAREFIVLIDLEDRRDCPAELARRIRERFVSEGWPDVAVVIKHRRFENWLIADIPALRKMPGRFNLTKRFQRCVSPDKADGVADAANELSRIAVGGPYHKRSDAIRICANQDPLRIAANSRSFRRFLRVAGHPKYAQQSRRP